MKKLQSLTDFIIFEYEIETTIGNWTYGREITDASIKLQSHLGRHLIGYIHNWLLNDRYIHVIFLPCRDDKTLECISKLYTMDVFIIKRNK